MTTDTNANAERSEAKKGKDPVHKIRMGAVTASVWRNGPHHDADLTVAFTQDDGETWRYTHRLGRQHLLEAAQAAEAAFRWIQKDRQRQRTE